jgi:hypothetical protein
MECLLKRLKKEVFSVKSCGILTKTGAKLAIFEVIFHSHLCVKVLNINMLLAIYLSRNGLWGGGVRTGRIAGSLGALSWLTLLCDAERK